jgi:hypothetical protein
MGTVKTKPAPKRRRFAEKRLKGFEPSTFCMASRRSSQLSYSRVEATRYRPARPEGVEAPIRLLWPGGGVFGAADDAALKGADRDAEPSTGEADRGEPWEGDGEVACPGERRFVGAEGLGTAAEGRRRPHGDLFRQLRAPRMAVRLARFSLNSRGARRSSGRRAFVRGRSPKGSAQPAASAPFGWSANHRPPKALTPLPLVSPGFLSSTNP